MLNIQLPLLVILGWIIGQPLSLYFSGFETVALLITVIIVCAIISDGKSNWLEGALLVGAYLVLCISFYFE
jgi:Ca2+:H+ antiporter